jgi:hypothetical protein
MRYVGPLQYVRLLEAREYYERCGFKYIDVPWAVSRDAVLMTRPPVIQGEPFSYTAGGIGFYPVASAEQSFLQMQIDATNAGSPITGSFCAITPCFRNEAVLDDLHQPYFMKLELISWDKTSAEDLNKMIAGARLFIENDAAGLWVDVIKNNDPDPIARHQTYDIVAKHTRIELGSYGIRQHEKVGRWLYGTGLAEPRYSYAIEAEENYKAYAGKPS